MALEKILKVTGRAVPVVADDVDTDRIIPARFMKCITFDGLGEFAFYDERKNEDGSNKPHPLNEPRYAGAKILISGANFGCGSSREHAPQSLHKYGFRGIVAESFAEIFFGNSCTLGIPCMKVSRENREKLVAYVEQHPEQEVTLDVVNQEISVGDLKIPAELPKNAREAFINGLWDPIAELLETVDLADQRLAALGYGS